jgi:pimeloyl-ACP methyl ester carboxylesterase
MEANADARERLLARMPVTERRLELAGVSTPVLEGGEGRPLVLLHGPGEHATKWLRIVPDLVETDRVIAPDLPGHGESVVMRGELGAEQVIEWLGGLIERTCEAKPTIVAQIVGGPIAARFAARHADRIGQLVLVDSLGLAPFEPAPEFGRALEGFYARPTAESHDELWGQCAYDLDRLRNGMGKRWDALAAYNLDRARTPAVMDAVGKLMAEFGFPPVDPAELERITVPTTLIWGRQDLATALGKAESASAEHGWPLYVIEDAADDPAIEQPEAFLEVLRSEVLAPAEMTEAR